MTATTKAPHRRLTEEERAAKRAAEREKMKEAIEALRSSEGWKRWLKVRRHFRSYSLVNQLLIAYQQSEATKVAGFRRWLSLGYRVRKGEKSIRIWAPFPPSKKKLKAWQEAGADPAEKPCTYFRLVPVFDRSQVDPLPDFPGGPLGLEPPCELIENDGLAQLVTPFVEFGASIGSEVCFESVTGSAHGNYDPTTRRIVVNTAVDLSPNAQVKTLIHELAHALVRHDRREDDPKLSYGEEEVVVESVAYTVCSAVGLDTSGYSIPYVTGWGGDDATEPIERYAELIDRLAKSLEDAALSESAPSVLSSSDGLSEFGGTTIT